MKNKKILCIILTLTILMTSLVYPNNSVKAETKTYENLEYEEKTKDTINIKRLLNRTTVTEVTIPEEIDGKKVTSISQGFTSSEAGEEVALKKITIPKTVESIGERSSEKFTNAENLEEIIVDLDSPYFCSVDGVLYNKTKTEVVAYPANKKDSTYTILDGVTQIDSYAFAFSNNLNQVNIPDTVEVLQNNSFESCSITSLSIPESVRIIFDSAFYRCSNLMTVENESSFSVWLDRYAFAECSNLTTFSMGGQVSKIGEHAFDGCTKLKNIDFETSGLGDIDEHAFANCPSLPRTIKFPDTLRELNKTAFDSDVKISFTGNNMVETVDEWEKCIKIKVDGTMDYTEAYKVFDLVNQERQKQNLSLLKLDKNLTDLAMQRAYEISVCFGFARPEIKSPSSFKKETLFRTGLQDEVINTYEENIAKGCANGAEAMDDWMNSIRETENIHILGFGKENILSTNFTSIGIGAVKTANGIYWVQIFGDGNYVEETERSNKTETRIVPVSREWADMESPMEEFSAIALTSDKTTIKVGETTNIRVRCRFWAEPSDTYLDQTGFKWSSSNEQVLQVDQNGNVTGISGGTADVIMTMSDGSTRKITITVKGLKGDIDNSGEVTTIDALLANSIFESGKEPTEEELQILDINEDGYITTIDALMINNAFETKTTLK